MKFKPIRVDVPDIEPLPKTAEPDEERLYPLELHELIDRYEILYPEVTQLADLRRSIIDQDLSSIFRITKGNDDLRSSVMDDNWHSIFRLLEPMDIPYIDDIRKATVEKNMYSLFRLLEAEIGNTEDLRRAVLEDNVYSLFRLFPETCPDIQLYRTAIANKNLRSVFRIIGDDNLRKVVVDRNFWKLWPELNRHVTTQFTSAFKSFWQNQTPIDTDCFSRGQLQSKMWIIDVLKQHNVDLGTVFLCAGWYATLATMLFESNLKVDRIRSFDRDPDCVHIAETFNKPWFADFWRFKAITEDIHNIDFNTHSWQFWSTENNRMSKPIKDSPNTIINTSCEHIENLLEWYARIPAGKLMVLQSNDYFDHEQHINCYHSIDEFVAATPMNTVLYAGELQLEKYRRFMIVGYK